MKAVIYARYSSSAQREASIEQQVEVCENYARNNDYQVIMVYSDKAKTGRTDDRPGLKKLLSDCSKNIFDVVLIYAMDRFSRDTRLALENLYKIEFENNKKVISVTQPLDDSPWGRFYRVVQMADAQKYSEELAEKVKRGMKYNADKCLYNGGSVPLGFKIVDKRYEINPDTAPIVKMIFEWYADGVTVADIAKKLNAQGAKTSFGRPFNKNSLHTLLKNKKYLGYYTFDGLEIPDAIPQIISDELFDKVAKRMATNKQAPARAKAKVEYILTTKLFCGHCKGMMTGFSATGHLKKTYRYYVCNKTKEVPKICNKKAVHKEYIEDLVIERCRKLLTTKNIQRITKELVATAEREKDTTNLKALRKALKDNERKHENAINAIMESDIESVRKALGTKIPVLEAEHEEIKKQIEAEERLFASISESDILFFLTSLKKGNINDIKYRKLLVNVFVNKIYLYDDKVTITFNSGDEPVTITDKLLSELDEHSKPSKGLSSKKDGPPYRFKGRDTLTVSLPLNYFGSGSSGARRRPCQTRNAQSFRVQVKTVRWTDLRESVGATIDRRCRSQGEAAIFLHLPHTDGPPETP